MTVFSTTLLGLGLLLLGFIGVSIALNGGFVAFTPMASARVRSCRRMQRGLKLGFRDRRLLERLAHALDIEDPLPLMIGRGCFEEAVDRLDPAESQLAAIENLRQRLHG